MLQNTKQKLQQLGVVAAGVGASVAAHATSTLPAEATAAFGTLTTNVADILSAVWPIVAAVVSGFVLIKLFKKGAAKI